MPKDPFQSGRRISWFTALALAAAAFASIAWLLPRGTTDPGLPSRMDFILANRADWVVGWVLRMVAAGLLLTFLVALSRALTPGHPILRSAAVQLVTIAAGAEIVAGTVLAVALPALGHRVGAGEANLAGVAQVVLAVSLAVSGAVGAGLTGIGGALLAHAAFRTAPFPRSLALLSLPIWALGVAAAGATLAGSTGGAKIVGYLFLPLLAVWVAVVALTFFRPSANA